MGEMAALYPVTGIGGFGYQAFVVGMPWGSDGLQQ
jgi:hypothetical protein